MPPDVYCSQGGPRTALVEAWGLSQPQGPSSPLPSQMITGKPLGPLVPRTRMAPLQGLCGGSNAPRAGCLLMSVTVLCPPLSSLPTQPYFWPPPLQAILSARDKFVLRPWDLSGPQIRHTFRNTEVPTEKSHLPFQPSSPHWGGCYIEGLLPPPVPSGAPCHHC